MKKSDTETAEAVTTNPYLNAKKVESNRTADLIGRVHLWQVVALASLLLALAGVAGAITFAARS
jgi:type IV secretory pathway TrbF-like protein